MGSPRALLASLGAAGAARNARAALEQRSRDERAVDQAVARLAPPTRSALRRVA